MNPDNLEPKTQKSTLVLDEIKPLTNGKKTKSNLTSGKIHTSKPKTSSRAESKKNGYSSTEKNMQAQLRSQILQRLDQIEKVEFAERKREFYQKRSEIRDEINQVLEGTHPIYCKLVKELEEEKDRQIKYADEMCNSRIEIYKREHEISQTQTNIDFQNERTNLINQLVLNVEERKRKIKDERDCLEVTSDFILETTRGSSKRNLRNRGLDAILNNTFKNSSPSASLTNNSNTGTNKRKLLQNQPLPGINDEEATSDLIELRKVTGVTGPIPTTSSNKKNVKSAKR
ncbi:hypothetical protein AYI68_g6447 [Smittium mucronatum]|uniref:Sin3 histone deacetylase corepressor complex component SDS3 n=1 Tax=Smittium mucronatum TaxID=133383 RepID=A0A1R0GRF8_9FUNG|nr:hypothetical protein AYI68_g6447 [Smittium mucronatum]